MTTVEMVGVLNKLEARVMDRAKEYIDQCMASYRQSLVSPKDTWCCKHMTKFASHVWDLPRPKHPDRFDDGGFGGVSVQLRGYDVIYCPFCGVKL
jgi:hypothetical protein